MSIQVGIGSLGRTVFSGGTLYPSANYGVKGQKMAQNDKTNLSHSVSQKLYLIWLWFLVHVCKVPQSLFWNIFAWWDTIYWQSLHWSVFSRNLLLTQLFNLGTIWAKIILPYVPGNYVSWNMVWWGTIVTTK